MAVDPFGSGKAKTFPFASTYDDWMPPTRRFAIPHRVELANTLVGAFPYPDGTPNWKVGFIPEADGMVNRKVGGLPKLARLAIDCPPACAGEAAWSNSLRQCSSALAESGTARESSPENRLSARVGLHYSFHP